MTDCFPILLAQSSSVPLQWLDVLVLAASVISVTIFGMWIGRKEETTTDYYLAGKTVAWWAVAGSIFGTNISSHHMVGMMGAGLKEGFAQANYEFGAIFGLLTLCYFFMPFYRSMGLYTLSQYLGRRFDERSQLVYSVTNMAYLLIQMVGTMILGALTVATLTADSPYAISYEAAVCIMAAVATAYTLYGGLKADIFNDVVQSVFLLIGSRLAGRAGDLASQRRRPVRLARKAAGEVSRLLRSQPSGAALDRRPERADGDAPLLLGHQPVHRAANAGRTQRLGRPHGNHRGGVLQAADPVFVHCAGHGGQLHPGDRSGDRKRYRLRGADPRTIARRIWPGWRCHGRPRGGHSFHDRFHDEFDGHAVHVRHLQEICSP